MKTLTYDPAGTPAPLRAALTLVAEDFPIAPARRGKPTVAFALTGAGPRWEVRGGVTHVSGPTIPQALRALATLRGFLALGPAPRVHEEEARLDTLGLMMDCSRNAVATPQTVRFFLRKMALMGMNLFMLYTEDTYEVPGEPYIGYLRGRFTAKEVAALDDYAHALGVEMMPCVQTLGHLAQMLRWWKRFGSVAGSGDFLYVGQPQTYQLIEKMLRAASAPYRSRRIHVGMDEAHGIGHGKYKAIPGRRSEFDIMIEHLRGVVKITNKLGLKPMMWSDMWFTIAGGGYYNLENKIPRQVAARIPRQMQLVYWDYYGNDPQRYAKMIDLHRTMGKEPLFAPGLWTDYVWWAHFRHAQLDTDAGMAAAKAKGLREAFTTLWGDDGMSANMLSSLTGLQHFAEHGYQPAVDEAALARQFAGSCGLDYHAWNAGCLDSPPTLAPTLRQWSRHLGVTPPAFVKDRLDDPTQLFFGHNPSVYLLWQDPLVGIYDGHLGGLDIAGDYRAVSARIAKARRAGPVEKRELQLVHDISRLLEVKGDLGVRLRRAYVKKDRAELTRLSRRVLPEALRRAKKAHESHRAQWFRLYKPNGWEVQDLRWAGLEGRLRSAKTRLDDYLAGRVESLPELAEKRLPISDFPKGKLGYGQPAYRRIVSPSTIV